MRESDIDVKPEEGDGWYWVSLCSDDPPDESFVSTFDEWVEWVGGEWESLRRDYPTYFVARVIHKERHERV